MIDIEILRVDPALKMQAIKTIREITGLSAGEVMALVAKAGDGVCIQVSPERAQESIRKLTEAGVEAKRNFGDAAVKDVSITAQKTETNAGFGMTEKFVPIAAPDEVQDLPREKLMEVLEEARKIAEASEYYAVEIPKLQNGIASGKSTAEKMRTETSFFAKAIEALITIVTWCVAFAIMNVFVFIICAVVWLIGCSQVSAKDEEKHKEENNARADKYIADHVTPLETKLTEATHNYSIFANSGRTEWVKDIVGDDLFYSGCIVDLYNLIKSRRADSLKEALNKYDDQIHKQQMEEMQKAIQNASEVSAKEAAKHTAQLREIEKNTRRTANAARSAAASSFGTYLNSKKK